MLGGKTMLHHHVVTSSLLLALLLALAAIPAARPALAVDSAWKIDASGNWSDAAKWTAGVPNAIGDIARLTYDITAARTVTIDASSRKVGSLYLSDDDSAWTLTGVGLNLDGSSGSALIQSDGGTGFTHIISAPISLYDGTTVAVDSGTLQVSGAISVAVAGKGITKTGAGTLVLSAANTYTGATTISGGALMVSGTGATISSTSTLYVSGGTLTVADGGVVTAGTLYASLSNLLGNGTITATKGAILDADLVFDATHGTTQTLALGTGGTLNLSVTSAGQLGAGYKGIGTLRIADGVTVTSATGYLGYNSGSTGTVTVTGGGSKWTTQNDLHVGDSGRGTLSIEAGGQVGGGNG